MKSFRLILAIGLLAALASGQGTHTGGGGGGGGAGSGAGEATAGGYTVWGNNTNTPALATFGNILPLQAGANVLGNGTLFQLTVPGATTTGNAAKYDANSNLVDAGIPLYTITSPVVGQVMGITGVSPTAISNTWVGNPLTGLSATSNTFLSTYREGWITNNNGSATTDSLPQAGSAGFDQNFGFFGRNRGAGKVTYSTSTSSIVGETILPQNAFIAAFSDPASTGVWYLNMWPTYGAYPNCPDSGGNHLNIDTVTTFAITCGTTFAGFVDNQQSGNYTVLAADFTACKSIPVTATGTVTLLGTAPANGQCVLVNNIGGALVVVTIGRNGLSINGAAANVTLFAGQSSLIVSDGTNYKSYLMGIPSAVTSTTAVTASNPTAATDTKLIELSLPAGFFNGAGSTFQYDAGGTLTTTAASVPQVTFTAKLCTVSACGSGTVVSLAVIQSTALNTTAVTNAGWNYNLVLVNNATGATGNVVAKGKPGLTIELGNATTVADSVFADNNNAVSSNIDLTAALFLDLFVQQSTTGASNSYKQMYASIAPPAGGNGGSSGAGGAPLGAKYLLAAADATLTADLVITPGDNVQRLIGQTDSNGGPYTLNFNPLDVSTVWVAEEFISGTGGALGWTASNIGASPTLSMQAPSSPHFGIVRMATTAVSGQGGADQLTTSSVGHIALNAQLFDSVYVFQLNQTVTENFFVGFSSAGSATPANFIGLRFDTTLADTNFMAVTCASSTCTATSLAVAADTSWHKIRIRSDVSGTIIFTLDAGSDVSISTNVPSAALYPAWIIVTQTTTIESAQIDYFAFKVRGLNR